MTSDLEAKMQELIDKQEIYELSVDYMRGQDRLDKKLQQSVYHDDATDDRGFFVGSGTEFVEFAQDLLSEHHANHHMLGQAKIEIEGDVAFGEVYFQAFHRVVENSLEKDFWVAGRYVDRYERRDGKWKIAHRTELNDTCWQHPATDDWLKSSPEALQGRHSMEDFSYKRSALAKK